MQQPSVFINGFEIEEPVTAFTDIMVGTACLYYAYLLYKNSYRNTPKHKQIIFYFILMGLATLSGGILGHALVSRIGLGWKLPGWLLSMVAVNQFERVIILISATKIKPELLKWFLRFNILELLIFMALAFGSLNFLFVQIHSTYGFLIVVFSFCLYNFRKGHHPEIMKDIMMGVGWIFICAVVFILEIRISIWFNHADLAHVFMFIGAFYFYRGSKGLMETNFS